MSRKIWPALAAVPLIVLACSSGTSDDEDDFYSSVTETPSLATPEPTPDPNVGSRLTTLVLEEKDGVDLDGDGRTDNNYEELLGELAKTIGDEFEDVCVTTLEAVLPDDVELPGGSVEGTCRLMSVTLEQALQSFINIDEFNLNIVQAFELGENYVITAEREEDEVDMAYHFAAADGDTYYYQPSFGEQSGLVDGANNAEVGTSDFIVVMELGDPSLVYMELIKSRTEAKMSGEGVIEATMGGVMTEEALIEVLMESLSNNSPAPIPDEILDILGGVMEQIVPDCGEEDTAMEECDEDLGGIAMGFTYEAEAVIAYPESEAPTEEE